MLGAVALATLAACPAPPRRDVRVFERSADHPGRLGAAQLAVLARARAALEAADAQGALALLDEHAAAPQASFALRRMHQDAVLAAGGERASALAAQSRELAELRPSCDNLLLWARVAPRADEARAAVEHALTLDPRSPWAQYAAGYQRAREGDWVGASEYVERALALDSGHRAARRLEAAILARAARSQEAISALEVWLAAVRDDPRVGSTERAHAQLDLAHLLVLDGEAPRALELLRSVSAGESLALTRWCLLAAAEQSAGRPAEALEAAESASRSAPAALLPQVQVAILREFDLGQRDEARAAWQRVLDTTRGATDLASLIQGLRARIVLERAAAGGAP